MAKVLSQNAYRLIEIFSVVDTEAGYDIDLRAAVSCLLLDNDDHDDDDDNEDHNSNSDTDDHTST